MKEGMPQPRAAGIVLTAEQEAACSCPPPQLIIAGAGSGKTTVITEKIIRLIKGEPARAENILALTFTEKAAQEMAERVRAALLRDGIAVPAETPTVTTFHSFGDRIISENMVRLGVNPGYRVASRGAQWQVLTGFFDELSFDAVRVPFSVRNLFGDLLKLVDQAKDHLVTPRALLDYLQNQDPTSLSPVAGAYWAGCLQSWREVQAAYEAYEQEMAGRNLIDFGDQIRLPVELFSRYPQVLEGYRRLFRYIFVDEYQDTNAAQRALLLALVDPDEPNVVVIGDDDQAIYLWRGAVVQNILGFPSEAIFRPAAVTQSTMTVNRRSYPPILDLAGAVIQPIRSRFPKTLRYHHEGKQGEAAHFAAESDAGEADWIAGVIRELQPWAKSLEDRKSGWGAFAVLCRKKSLFPAIAAALDRAEIPYELIGGFGFYDRPEIKDLLSYLLVVVDPADDIALTRILLSRRFQISDRDIFFLGRWRRKVARESEETEDEELPTALVDAVAHAADIPELSAEAQQRLQLCREEIEDFIRQAERMSIPGLILHILERTRYLRELEADAGAGGRIGLLNLQKLVDLASDFQLGDERASLKGFVEYVQFVMDSGEQEAEIRPVDEGSDTVKVMTVHQAKGLEFPCVFVPGLAEGLFPDKQSAKINAFCDLPPELRADRDAYPRLDLAEVKTEKEKKAALETANGELALLHEEEERRLCYVALTRAQYKLFFSRALWYGSNRKPKGASPFWAELVQTGLSRDLSVPSYPPAPVAPAQGGEASAGGQAAALLLDKEEAERFIQDAVARHDREGRWEELRCEADGIVARSAVERLTPRPTVAAHTSVFSYSSLACYEGCPLRYRFTYVDGLPTGPRGSARLGTGVHERIREHALGLGLAPPADFDESPPPDAPDEGGAVGEDALVSNYLRSVYGLRKPTYVEQPFHLRLGEVVVRGKMDRLDHLDDDSWELVDFKTGRSRPVEDVRRDLQLRTYALAAGEIWKVPHDRLTCTLFFLRESRAVSVGFVREELEESRSRILRLARRINDGDFPARPGGGCSYCDFRHLCGPSGPE